MTCDDCRSMLKNKSPRDATVAEWASVMTHLASCKECRLFMYDRTGTGREQGEKRIADIFSGKVTADDIERLMTPEDKVNYNLKARKAHEDPETASVLNEALDDLYDSLTKD